MAYKYEKVVEVRKVRWGHVIYTIGDRETWDRVTKREAMQVVKKYLT
jgi:hypothetical protein